MITHLLWLSFWICFCTQWAVTKISLKLAHNGTNNTYDWYHVPCVGVKDIRLVSRTVDNTSDCQSNR